MFNTHLDTHVSQPGGAIPKITSRFKKLVSKEKVSQSFRATLGGHTYMEKFMESTTASHHHPS